MQYYLQNRDKGTVDNFFSPSDKQKDPYQNSNKKQEMNQTLRCFSQRPHSARKTNKFLN